MKVDMHKNEATGVISVSIGILKLGTFDCIDGESRAYFPANTDRMKGEHFKAIGEVLTTLNNDACSICKHHGEQGVMPNGCNGCSYIFPYGGFTPN